MPISTTPGLNWGGFGLAGGIQSDPGAASNADDRVTIFVRGGGDRLYLKSQTRSGSWDVNWTPFTSTDGTVGGTPAALRGPDGIISVLWRSKVGDIWAMRQAAINAGYAPPVKIASGAASDPALVLNADGRITGFFNGVDRTLWHVDQRAVDYQAWNGPQSLGGDTGAHAALRPAAARDGDGLVHAFVHGADDEIWGITQKAADSSNAWSNFFLISARNAGVVGVPNAATDADQRIRVFWRAGTTGHYSVQPSGYGMSYGAAKTTQGTIVETPVAHLAMDGRLQVFVIATDRSLYICPQNQPNTDSFADAIRIGGVVPGLPVTATFADNRILVPHRGADSQLWAFEQVFI